MLGRIERVMGMGRTVNSSETEASAERVPLQGDEQCEWIKGGSDAHCAVPPLNLSSEGISPGAVDHASEGV